MIRNNAHWRFENYRQRMTIKQWRELLLNEDDKLIFCGHLRQLRAKNLGVGVVEVYKESLQNEI